jgi:hypothetical protein
VPVATKCYRFLRCQVHPAFDDVQAWFLEVRGDDGDPDPELVAAIHDSIAAKYRTMFGEDCHGTFGPGASGPGTSGHDTSGPGASRTGKAALLAADWLRSIETELQQGDVLVNPAGGFVAKRDLVVLEEIESDDLTWPEHYADEIITISRWPRGKHYYISSNRGRVFVPEKFTTYRAARVAALKYVSAGRIKSRV